MTRPPHAASSVVGYASDTASAVAKVEPNSNKSRETGRPYSQPNIVSLLAQTNQPTADQLSKEGSRQPCSQSISKDKSIY